MFVYKYDFCIVISKVKIGCGLINIGNSCFFSSTLQALFHISILTNCFAEEFSKKCQCIICLVRHLYQRTKRSSFCNPIKLYKTLQTTQFAQLLDGRQQDAHEFLKHLIEGLVHENHIDFNLENTFVGKLRNYVNCFKCNITYESECKVGDFIVEIDGKRSVQEAFESFFATEVVEEYNCIGCMESILASKKCRLVSTPKCLCIVLNRVHSQHVQQKISSNVEVNKEFIVKCFTDDGLHHWKYKLAAVIDHVGPNYNEGHYITTVNCNDTIYSFDDAKVRKKDEVPGRNAYILFYERIEETLVDEIEEWVPIEIDEDDECVDNDCETKNMNDANPLYTENEVIYAVNKIHEDSNEESEEWIPIEIIDDDDEAHLNENDLCMENEVINLGMFPNNKGNGCFAQNTKSKVSIEKDDDATEKTSKMENKDSSRRIVDIEFVFSQMQEAFGIKCKKCGGDMTFTKETKRGLISKFHFTCSSCGRKKPIDSCPKHKNQANNNEAAVTGIISVGLGYYHLQEFFNHFNVPCMSYQTFYNIEKVLQADWWALAKELEADVMEKEILLSQKNNEVDSAGNALIPVKVDGSWHTRSYGKNFKSIAGCAAIVGARTNKIIYCDVKNKYCHTCKIAASKNSPPNLHECNANWTGPSTGMETTIIVEGFKYCAERGVRFNKFVGDGDSSTYKALRDLRLYQNPNVYIDKYDCVNHVHKNFFKKFTALETNTKFNKKSRKHLSPKIALDISKGVRMAAKYWNKSNISLGEKCTNLEIDCMNAPLHCLGIHENCAKYFCTKTTAPEAMDRVALLKSNGLYYEILGLCQHYFANKAKSLLAELDNNVVEGFNSIIAKIIGGKRVNNALAGSYKSRTAMASVHLNSGYHGGSTFQRFKYGKVLPTMLKMENKRKRKVEVNTIRKEANKQQRRMDDQPSEKKKKKGYGEGHEDVDMSAAQFEIAKNLFLERLEKDRINREVIQAETLEQRYNTKYCQLKQDLLTSSYFSRILHSRSRKSYKKIVDDILYHNALYTNTADQNHQRLLQIEALEIFSRIHKNETINVCGMFIDQMYSFLGTSPFRLIAQDGMLVIKCPRNVFGKSVNDAIQKNLIPFWTKAKESEVISVNRNSHWYMHIQGQLHISRKKFAYLMVYLGPSEYKIEKVDRNDEYWKTNMESELVYFFNEAMLKELVDSRDARGMELRDYDENSKTFI